MARKSRRNKAAEQKAQSAQNTQNIEILNQTPTAAYVRLSLENSGNETEDSIQTQIMLVHGFIQSRPDLKLEDTYIDNGYSGTNFDRPEFERMMQDVYAGKIQCIVVKDLSRFGRNYLEIGHYMETVFPRLNIRFIAVTDDFDNSRKEDVESLAVPIKNMVNSLYAKDISRKVASLNEMKRQKGELTTTRPQYGYLIDHKKHCYVPDAETAPYVRAIFRWTLEGISCGDIARRLELLGVPAPCARCEKDSPRQLTGWNAAKVSRILHSSTYVGEQATGKTRKAVYKGMKEKVMPKEEWIVRKDAHEALVSRPDFERVQSILDDMCRQVKEQTERNAENRAASVNHFGRLLFCAGCQQEMKYTRIKRMDEETPHLVYSCSSLRGMCQNSPAPVNEKMLMILVMDQIRNLVHVALDYGKLAKQILSSEDSEGSMISLQKKMDSLSYRMEQADERRTGVYEDYADGLLNAEEYQYMKEHYISEKQNLQLQFQETARQKEQLTKKANAAIKLSQNLEQYLECREFDEELVRALVDKIYLGGDNTIKVVFRFQDVFREFQECLEGVTKSEE
ncbi:MAG: recombinase family protein [Lachnospiraceae bacterium]|nr:recombinase family protein [Lachnospiraceae bacterium]